MATAAELWAAAAQAALCAEDEADLEIEIADDGEEMVVEEGAVAEADGYEAMTAEEEAAAAVLVQEELAAEITVEGEVVLEAEVEAPEDEAIEIDVDVEEEAPVLPAAPVAKHPQPPKPPQPPKATQPPLPPKPPQPRPQQPAPEAPGKACGKGAGAWKGQAKGKGKGVDKGGAAPGGKGKGGDMFYGLVHQIGEKTGNMLVKSWKVSERYGTEAMIPKMANPAGAVVGDKISFEILERENGARPLAVNVVVRGHVDLAAQAQGPPNELRRQILYYLSDDNLKTDKFFQGVIASNEGGWIPMTTILGCPRMKQMKATVENVFAAVRDATEVELKEAPAGEEAIRRTTPAPALDMTHARDWGGGKPKGGKFKGDAKGKSKGEAKGFEAKGFGFEAKGFAKGFAKGEVKGEAKGAAKGKAAPESVPEAASPEAVPEAAPEAAPEETADAAMAPAGGAGGAGGAGPCEDVYYAGVVKSQMRMEPRKLFVSCEEVTAVYGRDAYFLPSQKPQAVEVGSLVVFSVPGDSEVGFSPQANFVAQLAPLGSLGRDEEEAPSNGAGAGAVGSASKGPAVQKTIVKRGGKGGGH